MTSLKLTPTAAPLEPLRSPRQERMNTGTRLLQRTGELQPPALLGRVWARPQNDLGSTSVASAIDVVHIDQGGTAGVEDPGIGLQPTDQLNRASNPKGWIVGAWGWCPPQQSP
jgi:hypothetical protein